MKLNLHARIEVALAAVLLLGSCGTDGNHFSDAERDEIADIAGDGNADANEFSALQSRVEAIEQHLGI